MKTALIISGGDFHEIDPKIKYDYVIACDKGALYARNMNIVPDLILGDFDSYDGNIQELFPDVLIDTYPVMKDDTDTMLAIKEAFKRGFEHIVIICALGGRLDHTMSNIQSLGYIAGHGGIGEIYSDREHISTLSKKHNSVTVKAKENTSLSLYSLSDECTGVTISGAKYNADKITLVNTFPLGHGNSILEHETRIEIKEGILLIIESKF